MFNFRKGVARISSVFVILFAFLITQVYGAPAKVSTNTVAAKAAPAGAVGAKPDVVKKVAPKAPAKALAKAPAKAPAKAVAKVAPQAPVKPVAKVVKKESVVEKFAPQLKPKVKKPQKKKVVKSCSLVLSR